MTRTAQNSNDQHVSDAWIPEAEGDVLRGLLMDVTRGWSDVKRDFYPLLTVREDDGTERKWHAFSAVAEARVLEVQPIPGEVVTITYLGESKKAKPGQNAAKLFRLVVDGRDPAVVARRVYEQLGADTPKPPPVVDEPAPDDGSDHPF